MKYRFSAFASFVVAFVAHASAQQVYMSGLSSPRGLTFGSDGTLYVAEAGSGGGASGPTFTGGDGVPATFGLTGGVSSRLGNGAQQRIISNLPSLAANATNSEATGPADVTFAPDGSLAVLFGLGAGSTARSTLPSTAALLGTLSSFNKATGGFTTIQDYAALEQTTNPDGGEINSNPFSVVRDGTGYAVADSGANVLWRSSGATLLPSQLEPSPFGAGQVPQDSVPTGVIARKGGGFLVGSLGGFPFTQGESRIFSVLPDGTLTSTKAGLTSIIDLAYAPDGSLLVEEIYANGLLAGGPGDIKRIEPNGTIDTLITGLDAPTSMAFGPDGYLYITDDALSGNAGEVLRYNYSPVPEPTSLVALGLGVAALLRRRRR